MGESPEKLRFSTKAFGKPCLWTAVGKAPLHFSASHSRNIFLLAMNGESEVGIDVERLRTWRGMEEYARQGCSLREWQLIHHLAPEQRNRAFLRLWTRKEAHLKALGFGLSIPPNLLDLSGYGRKCEGFSKDTPVLPAGHPLIDLETSLAAVAALATIGPIERVLYRGFNRIDISLL